MHGLRTARLPSGRRDHRTFLTPTLGVAAVGLIVAAGLHGRVFADAVTLAGKPVHATSPFTNRLKTLPVRLAG